jgi:two-component system sensor histidine kinase/response regulator
MNPNQDKKTEGHSDNREQSTGIFSLHNVCIDEALARFGGDHGRYKHWLTEFIAHGPAATAQIRQAINNGSNDAAVGLVHALKGRTGMLGMSELHAIAQSLEQALRDAEPATLWLEELELSVNEMSRAIADALGTPAA